MVSTLEKVKQAAFSLFARQGYEFTTMNQIATAVGIKKPSLYAHFESKEALFLAVFTDMEQAYQKHMRQVFSDTGQYYSTEAKLYHIFEQYIAYFAQDQELSALWNRILLFPPAALKEMLFTRIAALEAEFHSQVTAIIESGIKQNELKAGSAGDVMFSFYCLREGLLWALLINQKLESYKVKMVWEHFWRGISK